MLFVFSVTAVKIAIGKPLFSLDFVFAYESFSINLAFSCCSQGIIMLIMATDMARHSEILDQFKAQVESGFNFDNQEHLNYVSLIFINPMPFFFH